MTVDVKINWTKNKSSPSFKSRTYKDLFAEIGKKKAKGNPIGEFEWEDFKWKIYADKKSGNIAKVVIDAAYRITVPKWPAAGKASPAEKKAWEKCIAALAKHEETHRLYHLEALAKFNTEVNKLAAPTLADVETLLATMQTDHKKEQKAYDGRTGHGVKEGATLPHPDSL
ncbi:hypothetical protein LNKW23_21910 [Paralimibaculum aggregatum]|uniref:DUF922 domain-containing protein n=1 Tax=Paralimibaculum aggregatum TaxID=3036245 RepID=A0ABQ6LP14_9RHOB|nr:DUF922 domain-containing protein [Limibaculum sp. NKW23]GMG82978.1 hypothetical protein LNKW23_21910 [Limibaculum sp. NKW23]